MAQLQNLGSESDNCSQVHHQSIIVPASLISIAPRFEKNEHSWFAVSDIPTDLTIQVQGITFHVHKYALISKCGYLAQLDLQTLRSESGPDVKLENLPGGSETFEIILQFSYGLPISLNPSNVAALRCSAEFLEMTEVHEDGNLISKTEAFLLLVVLSSWGDSITVLKSCESLSPWAENLQIVRRCCESIAWKASKDNIISEERNNEEQWWFKDVATLRMDHFVRIVRALRAKRSKPEIIGSCLVYYAGKWLPGMKVELERSRKYSYTKNEMQLSILSNKRLEENAGVDEQRMIVESLISILPPQKEAVSCKFLLGILRMALVYSASPALVSELEKRIGIVLENADANDLLVPNCANGDQSKMLNCPDQCTMYNTDIVRRIVEYYIMHEQLQPQQQQQKNSRNLVSKLLDNFLAEIARDPNLSISKFQVLAETLPDGSRICHDGIYRAIDTYLKSHPSLSEHDRRRLCKIMNSEKLSLDACMHASQNDRLPLRIVVQVLFSEQVKLRAAVRGKGQVGSGNNSDKEESQSTKEIRILKDELESLKANMQELQRDCNELQREYENLNHKQKRKSLGWALNWRKIRSPSFLSSKVDEVETRTRERSSSTSRQRVSLRQRLSVSDPTL